MGATSYIETLAPPLGRLALGLVPALLLAGLAVINVLGTRLGGGVMATANLLKLGGEIRQPEKNLPRALTAGVLLVTAIYLLVSFAFLYIVPLEKVVSSTAFVAQLGGALFGGAGPVPRGQSRGRVVDPGPRPLAGVARGGRRAVGGGFPAALPARPGMKAPPPAVFHRSSSIYRGHPPLVLFR